MAIHWWQTEKLVQELASDGVSEQQSLRYAMLSAILVTTPLYYAYWFGGERGWLLFLEYAAVCVISLIGLHECFKANGASSGKHFLKRIYCLAVPVGLKLLIASIVVGQILYYGMPRIVTSTNFRNPHFVDQLATFFIVGVFAVFFYWRIAYHLGRVAQPERSNPLMQPTGKERTAAD